MKKILLLMCLIGLFFHGAFGQNNNITNKLGSSGSFQILKSNDAEILTASEATGFINAAKVAFTPEGGIAVKVTNKTGANTVKGTIVSPYGSGADNAVTLSPTSTPDRPSGVMYSSGVSNNSECWIVISGIAEVLLQSTPTANPAPGLVVMSSTATSGRADCVTDPNAAGHDKECGHFIETKTGGDQLVKAIIHFR